MVVETLEIAEVVEDVGDLPRFPDFPPRDDMQNWKYLYRRSTTEALENHFPPESDVTVANEVPLGPDLSVRDDLRIPDLMVIYDADEGIIYEQRGYEISRHGKAPEFVLEVASPTTGVEDYTNKRSDYERYGVLEFWRFDSSGGSYHDAALAGDRLVNGRYRRIEIVELADGSLRGYSAALGLYLCWEDGALRFYDPVTEEYLSSYGEERAARRAAEDKLAEMAAEIRRLRGE